MIIILLRKIFQKIPYLYFFGIWFLVALEGVIKGRLGSYFVFLICLPFAYQLWKEKKGLNLLMGILMLFWTILLLFAYLSDVAKINDINTNRSMRFVIGAGLFVVMNFLMTGNLIKKAVDKNPLKAQNSIPELA